MNVVEDRYLRRFGYEPDDLTRMPLAIRMEHVLWMAIDTLATARVRRFFNSFRRRRAKLGAISG